MFVNVPIGAALAFAAFRSLHPERRTAVGEKLDTMGAVTVTAAVTLLVYGIVTTGQHSWSSPVTVTFLAAGIVMFGVFLLITHVLVPLLLTGAGLGLSFVPSTMSGTAGLPPNQAGLASGLITTTTRQVGAAIGFAVMTTAATTHVTGGTGLRLSPAITSAGIDRAFAINAAILVAGALFALLLQAQSHHKAGHLAKGQR